MPDSPTLDWDSFYQDGSRPPWQRSELNPAFEHWVYKQIVKPCRILVPGCGDSLEVVEFARAGFDVTALDISKSAIDLQRQHLKDARLHATLENEDVLTWMPAHAFDAIYEQTCLCALLPEDRHHYHHQLRHWLKPEGKLLALFMQTGKSEGPPYDCPLDDMRELFTAEHWRWPEPPYFQSPHHGAMHELGVILTRHEVP